MLKSPIRRRECKNMASTDGASATKRVRTELPIPLGKKSTRGVVAKQQQAAASKASNKSSPNIKKEKPDTNDKRKPTLSVHESINPQKIRSTDAEIDEATWKWFQRAVRLHVHVTGPMVQSTALKFAIEFGDEKFKASNAWLQNFRSAHKIINSNQNTNNTNGRTGDNTVDEQNEVMGYFFSELPELCASYLPEDVFNAVEVGLLYKALPCRRTDRLSSDMGDSQTDYVTILLATSAAGEKLTPIVIGKEAPVFPTNPADNGGDILPVEWRRNLKAWMTSRSFVQWLNDLNVSMCGDDRNIILFLSSGLAHPNVELSNVRLCFFPPKQPSGILPLHHGVSQSFKAAYRREFLSALLQRSVVTPDVGDALRLVTVLDVAGWIDVAWRSVTEELIPQAFESAGFPIALPPQPDDDGALDTRLRDLIMRAGEKFSLPYPLLAETEFVNIDSWVPVYPTIESVVPRLGPACNGGGALVAATASSNLGVRRTAVPAAATAMAAAEKVAETTTAAAVVVAKKNSNEEIPSNDEVRIMIQKLRRYALLMKPDILPDILRLESSFNGAAPSGGERRTCCECYKEKQIIVLD